jgi:hypothetical protein
MSRSKTRQAVVLSWVLFAMGFVTLADESKPPEGGMPGQNVLITLTVSKTGGTGPGEKIYKMMGQDRSDANMMVGWRTPIPTTSAASDDTGKAPTTNYIYQNVGIQAKLSIRILDKGRIWLKGGIEISGARDSQVGKSAEGAPPMIGTFQQTLSAVVAEGKKLRVAEGPDPTGGIVSLDIEATTLH